MNTSNFINSKPPPPPGRPSISQRAAAIRLASRSHGSTSSSSSSKGSKMSMEGRGAQPMILPEKEAVKTTTNMDCRNISVVKKKKSSNKIKTISSLNGMLLHPAIQKIEYVDDEQQPVEEPTNDPKGGKSLRGSSSFFFNFSKNTRPRFMRSKNKDQYPRVEEAREDSEFIDEVDSDDDVWYGAN